jgi:hypothetical protein
MFFFLQAYGERQRSLLFKDETGGKKQKGGAKLSEKVKKDERVNRDENAVFKTKISTKPVVKLALDVTPKLKISPKPSIDSNASSASTAGSGNDAKRHYVSGRTRTKNINFQIERRSPTPEEIPQDPMDGKTFRRFPYTICTGTDAIEQKKHLKKAAAMSMAPPPRPVKNQSHGKENTPQAQSVK